uniref:Uncharacterized protein n=1 Tax=Plectus sambesii TaxID=2011161 RepID=A0A914VP43_9BILA
MGGGALDRLASLSGAASSRRRWVGWHRHDVAPCADRLQFQRGKERERERERERVLEKERERRERSSRPLPPCSTGERADGRAEHSRRRSRRVGGDGADQLTQDGREIIKQSIGTRRLATDAARPPDDTPETPSHQTERSNHRTDERERKRNALASNNQLSHIETYSSPLAIKALAEASSRIDDDDDDECIMLTWQLATLSRNYYLIYAIAWLRPHN